MSTATENQTKLEIVITSEKEEHSPYFIAKARTADGRSFTELGYNHHEAISRCLNRAFE